jgi:hypothetical protein
MRSLIITPAAEVTDKVLHNFESIHTAIGCDSFDGRRVCRIPGGFLSVYFDDASLAQGLPVNKHAQGLCRGELRGTVVLQACNEMGATVDLPSSMTTDNWRKEVDSYKAMPEPARPSIEEIRQSLRNKGHRI